MFHSGHHRLSGDDSNEGNATEWRSVYFDALETIQEEAEEAEDAGATAVADAGRDQVGGRDHMSS